MSRCPKCGGTTGDDASGSLTQWIIRCQCRLSQDQEPERRAGSAGDNPPCSRCGKTRRASRSGSFTQWVFASSLCDCEGEESESDSERSENLDAGTFPYERYEIRELVGSGASSQVYACWDNNLKKTVAVKILTDYDPEKIMAFQNESRILASLTHPAIVPVIDFSTTSDGTPYMVLELSGGTTLASRLAVEGTLPIPLAVAVARSVCSGLAYAHDRNVYHRDIKPANIIVTDAESAEPAARILDFGIALTRNRKQSAENIEIAGTPLYMSPDQARGHEYDEKSEIYSLGCVIYEMVTGHPPFEAENHIELIAMHAGSPPPDLTLIAGNDELARALSRIVIACLAKDRDLRPASMEELEKRLADLPIEPALPAQQAGEPELAGSLASLPPAGTARLTRAVYSACGVAALLLAACVGLSLMQPARKLDLLPDKTVTSSLLSTEPATDDELQAFVFQRNGTIATSESTTRDADIEKLVRREDAGRIKELRLINPAITRESLKWIKLLNLTSLWIKNSTGTMSSSQILFGEPRGVPENEHLDLTDQDLKGLLDGTGLTEIQLEGLPVEGTCFEKAAGSGLRKIRLMDCRISDAGLKAIAGVRTTTWLCLRGADQRFSEKNGIARLRGLDRLAVLEISINQLEAGGTDELGNLTNLTALYLFCDRRLGEGELHFLSRLPRLRDFRLAGHCLSEDSIDSLAGLDLTVLALRDTNLDDELMSRLPPLPVATLFLDNSLIEGTATGNLKKMRNLRSISVSHCHKLTPRGLERLRKELPDCTINRGEDEGTVEIIPYVPAGP
ncbi:MAG: protein kinase [Candidatus Melainabacteria bacterium]|nr:protein kinase [Candidatus Melainabacteria bacterium]